jgi:hypothetical protein
LEFSPALLQDIVQFLFSVPKVLWVCIDIRGVDEVIKRLFELIWVSLVVSS